MIIQELYDRDIERRINPAVVVSEMEEYSVDQEIGEYVFTKGVTKNIYKFLNAFTNKKEGKTGVWISGYYGSGKSHFIKYIFYCLNQKFREKAFANFAESVKAIDPLDEPNLGLVSNIQRKLDVLTIDEIIFNIDAVADNKNEKDRITRVLLNQLNSFRGYNNNNIALALYLEKPLQEAGFWEPFKERIKVEFSENWEGNQIRFMRMFLNKVIEIAKEFLVDIDNESLKSSIIDKNQDYSIDFLIDELKSFLVDKGLNYRLIFLMDEVSQYIGSNTSLLLNLQTIIEEIGSKIGPLVWIVCTAQQDLTSLIDNTDSKTEDFGKILGRFETMISLESQDAAFITKRRVLSKKSEGIGLLNDYYKSNKGAIENQFVFDHDLYKNFTNREEFTLTYPFIPYQFRLISDVFESFSNVGYVGEGVKNTERAILGITHFTAKLCKEDEIGFFVPFDLFFNEQLEKNLTHHARSILDRAYHIEDVKTDKFARRVVNALFMVSNLGDSQKVNFPANIENLALLLMSSVDTPKLDMQFKVQQVLDELVKKNIIQASEGKYRFLKEDEIEVANLIRSNSITTDDKLSYFYNDIILKKIKPSPFINLTGFNKPFKAAIYADDKEFGSKGDFNIKFSIYDSTELEQLAHSVPSHDMVIVISEWLRNDQDLKSIITDYIRTQLYIRNNTSNATGTRSETLNSFRTNNLLLLDEISFRFEKKFLETSFISNNRVVKPENLNGASPTTRFDEMVKRHIEEIYRKHKLSNGYAISNADLIANAKSGTQISTTGLEMAEEELNTKLSLMGDGPVVGEVVKLFEKAPYGWKDITTLDVLLRLGKKGVRRFEWRNEEIDLPNFADKALNSREREAITIHKEKAHSQDETNAFIHAVNHDIFNENLITPNIDFKAAVDAFKKSIETKLSKINKLKNDYEGFEFVDHLKKYHKILAEIYGSRNPEQLVNLVINQKRDLKLYRDTYMYVEEFIENNFTAYKLIYDFANSNKGNFDAIDEVLQIKAQELTNYLKTDAEPWDRFPQMRKAYKEISDAIQARIAVLKEDTIKRYQLLFEEIELKINDLGISETHLIPDATTFFKKLKSESHIPQLEIHLLKASDFRAENFKILEDFKAKQDAQKTGQTYIRSFNVSLAAEMSPTIIENPDQLDDYINKLRERLMVKLAKNKKIFLN